MKNILLATLIYLFSISNSNAQEVQKFSLKAAIDYAFEHQANVLNARLDEEISKKKIDELTGLGTPQIEGSADLNNFLRVPTSFVPAEFFGGEPGTFAPVQFGQKYTSSAGISASQLIFDGSYIVGLQASRAYAELATKQTRRTKVETSIIITKAYFSALVSESGKVIVDANIERLTKLLEETKQLNINGFAEKIDVDRLQLNLNNLYVERDNIVRITDYGYALLKFQMGLSNSTKVELTDKLEDYDLTNVSLPDTADYNKRPDYAVLMSDRKLQSLDLKRYQFAYYPSLIGYGNLSANASRDNFNIFNTSEPWFPTAVIGLKLSVPIWDGLQKNSRVQQSKLGLAKVDNSLNQYRNSIQLEYTSAQSTFKTKLASLEITKQNRVLAVEIARVSKVKYDNGLGSSLELTDAESALKEADANYLNTLYETIVAKIELDRVLGNTIY